MNKLMRFSAVTLVTVLIASNLNFSFAQSLDEKFEKLGLNTITTAVPFLVIAPDSRSGALGDAGVAISPDANSIHWNPAKLAFVDDEIGIAVSYTPWLRKLVSDISLSYLSFYKKIDERSTFGVSLRYFTLGNIQFTNIHGQNTIQFNPNEFTLDGAYARKLSEKWGGGMALRYVYSNLTGGMSVGGADSKPGQSVAVDISTYYEDKHVKLGDKDAIFAFGANISNIGSKMSYTETSRRDFIPINLRLGPRLTVDLDEYNSISITADFNKLLTPTPPVYKRDSLGVFVEDPVTGDYVILSGKDPDRAVASGIFSSFTDAPGRVSVDDNGDLVEVKKGSRFGEEMREITISTGVEYWYDKQLAIRVGYFHEHSTKGNRKYITVGAGLKYKVFGLDFAYLIPVNFDSSNTSRSPLENTLRFTLRFDLEAFKSQESEIDAE